MFVVIFEVEPRAGHTEQYLDLAKQLKPKLEAMDGFIEVERFKSRKAKGRLLSVSSWRDEKSMVRWRTHRDHYAVQRKGRLEVFADYRLRVGEIASDSALPSGVTLHQQRFDATEIGEAKFCSITEIGAVPSARHLGSPSPPEPPGFDPGAQGLIDQELYESPYTAGKLLRLASWRDDRTAAGDPPPFAAAGEIRHRLVRIIRDYGLFERREAPQYYPEVERSKAAGPARLA
jgi:heme-degrading monooxygenase HmoA